VTALKGIVLFGHGSRNPAWVKPFLAIRSAMLARSPDVPVTLGFLEAMRPTLDEAIDSLVADGAKVIEIVPIFLATGSHITKDLPQLAASAMDRHPCITITIAEPAGESARVIDAMADYALGPAINPEHNVDP
jgi:sirohydrochlorin cobaltochelatase